MNPDIIALVIPIAIWLAFYGIVVWFALVSMSRTRG